MSANSQSYSLLVRLLSFSVDAIGGSRAHAIGGSRALAIAASCALAIASCTLMAQSTTTPPAVRILVIQPVDSNRLVTLAGNTRPEANSGNDRGKVADTFAMPHMLLQMQRSPEREQALRNFMDQQHDSASPNFHKWLTAAEFGQLYGPAPQDIESRFRMAALQRLHREHASIRAA